MRGFLSARRTGNGAFDPADSSLHEESFARLYGTSDGGGRRTTVTEQGQLKELFLDSEKNFRILAGNLPVGISLMSQDCVFEYFNPRFTAILGYTLEDLPDKWVWFEEVYPDVVYRDRIVADWRRFLLCRMQDGKAEEKIVTVRCKDGTDKILSTRTVVLEDGRHLETYEDITEYRRLEAQLRHSDKMETLGTLAGGITHDFNHILGIIMGYAELAENSLPEYSRAKLHLEELVKAARRGKDLVSRILAFSHAGGQERERQPIVPIVQDALKLLRTFVPPTVTLRKEIAPLGDDDLVLTDPTEIYQVLMNLCINGAQAMSERGGELLVKLSHADFDATDPAKPPEVDPGKYVRLSVADSGPGIAPGIVDQIFKAHFTTKGPGQGTGLGLFVVYRIVKSHRGAVTVNSEPGKGTAFHVYFPTVGTGLKAAQKVSG
jgi:PAS domain S-box-containing protein